MILKINQDTHGDFLRYQESARMTFDTTRLHKTCFQSLFSQKSQDYDKMVADVTHRLSDSEPEVDKVGIYVDNYQDWNRECINWMQFNF